MTRDTARIFEDFIRQAEETDLRVRADTELYRKANARLTVLRDGKPVPGARVTLCQKTHEFRFGANLFMLDELETPEKNDTYKKLFADVFNLATLPFYWDTLEPEQGKPRYAADSPKIYRRPAPDLCLDFCEAHGIEPKLHCLGYDYFTPAWYKNAPVSEAKRLLEKRFCEIAERYASRIPDIEVTNEHFSWRLRNSSRFYMEQDFTDWCYRMAEKYFPTNNLVINEGTGETWRQSDRSIYRQGYYLLVDQLLKSGRRIDKIGTQFHIWQAKEDDYENTRELFNPEHLFRFMDAYGLFGRDMQVTEITFPARGDAPEDEDYQAEVLERLYRIWFSHKNMQAIIYWNLVDGYAYGAPIGDMTTGENVHYGGLVNFDMTPKKAYYRLKKLMQEEWHSEGSFATDDDGKGSFRGFCGSYDAEILCGEKKITRTVNIFKHARNEITIEL